MSETAEPTGTPPSIPPSRATRVTFFEDRAEVTRTATFDLQPGPSQVRLGGVSPYVADRSVQAAAAGQGVRVTGATVRRMIELRPVMEHAELHALEAEAKAAELEARRAAEAMDRLAREAQHAEQLYRDWLATLAQLPPALAEDAVAADWRTRHDELLRRRLEARDQHLAQQWRREDAERVRLRARERLAHGQARLSRTVTWIEVQLDLEAPATLEVEVTYQTPCALWRPEHVLHLGELDADGHATAELVTFAAVWHRAAETWDAIDARFSTARPAAAANAPILPEDVLLKRVKTADERRHVDVEIREETVSLAGLGADSRTVDELPGVDDGGQPRLYAAQAPIALTSNGLPARVEIQRRTVDVQVARVLMPELAAVAHVKATGTLTGGPLLAGPARVVRRGSLIGRCKLKFIADGERFELGFGPDDAVRARRQTEQKRDTTLLGTQKVQRTVELFVSNISGELRRVTLTERVLISEIDDVQVKLLDTKGWRWDAEHGFLHRDVDLPPRRTDTFAITYELTAKSNVNLPF